MSTAADVEAAFNEAAGPPRCSLGKLLDGVAPDVREVIEAKVADDVRYSAATIARVLKKLGFAPITDDTITKHRRDNCRCA